MISSPLALPIIFHLGPVPITGPVVTTWAMMVILVIGAMVLTRWGGGTPGRLQVALELLVETLLGQARSTMRVDDARPYLPLLGTLFIFLLVANLSGLLPGVSAPTGHIETAGALALLVFCAVQFFGVRRHGVAGYFARFLRPAWFMLPLNVLAEFTRTVALAIRLFGNIMSGGFVIAIVVALAGLFVPVPLMALELLTGLVQAYIFTVLAAVFIGGAVSARTEA